MSTSPHIKTTMNFTKALNAMLAGSKVTRLEWNDAAIWTQIRDEKLMIHWKKPEEPKYEWYPLTVREVDVLAEDWVVL